MSAATTASPSILLDAELTARTRRWHAFIRHFGSSKVGPLGLILVMMVVVPATFAPLVAPYAPNAPDFAHTLDGPSRDHLLGTDQLGRDLFSRLIYGGRLSLTIPIVIVLASGIIGTIAGATAGYAGGLVDGIILRIGDVLLAFPGLLLALSVASALGNGMKPIIIAGIFVSVPGYMRLVRGVILGAKQLAYVEAARALGVPPWRIVAVHIMPNVLTPIIVQCSVQLAAVLLLVSALSFLGIGVQPPTAEWGVIVSGSRGFLHAAPHLMFFSGVAIVIAVLGFNLLGDGLRDALDVRTLGK